LVEAGLKQPTAKTLFFLQLLRLVAVLVETPDPVEMVAPVVVQPLGVSQRVVELQAKVLMEEAELDKAVVVVEALVQ
jgi:hypothetical protein